jgi:hypothetical protein
MKINLKELARKASPLVWVCLTLGILFAIFVNAANIRGIAVQHPGQFKVGDVLMKDSGDLATMPYTLYGQTLNEPVISTAWGSAIETAALVTVAHGWLTYAAFISLAIALCVRARQNKKPSPLKVTAFQNFSRTSIFS